jgi:hypothetical protein
MGSEIERAGEFIAALGDSLSASNEFAAAIAQGDSATVGIMEGIMWPDTIIRVQSRNIHGCLQPFLPENPHGYCVL